MKNLSTIGRQARWGAIVALLFFVLPLMAQNVRMAGVVVDSNGDPLPGATVAVVGKANIATTANINGQFTLNVPQNSVMSFSFIGFKTQTFKVKKQTGNMRIVLEDDSKMLSDVVVTALGITREAKSLGYARQGVDTESLEDVRDPNLLNSLSGKVAGMNIISNGGPMSSTRVEIRGNNSITGNNQPLYVIDGVPILNDMGEVNGGADDGNLDYGNAASYVSPDDIESIEVLKGANASALYGSDAANGVILITTKKAKAKKGLGIAYNSNFQLTYLRDYPDYQNIYGSQGLVIEGYKNGFNYFNSGSEKGYSYNPDWDYGIYIFNKGVRDQRSWGMPMLGREVIGRNDVVRNYSPDTKSITDLYETGTQWTNNVSFSKVFNGASIRASYTGILYSGILQNFNDMRRHNFSVNASADPAKWLNINLGVNYQLEDVDNRDYKGDSRQNPLNAIANMTRDVVGSELLPYKRADGQPYTRASGFYNPYWLLNECKNGDDRTNFRGNVTVNIKPMKGLNIRLRGSMERQNKDGWKFQNMYTMWDQDGRYEEFFDKNKNDNFEAVATYNTRFKNKMSLNATAGTSYQKVGYDKLNVVVNALAARDIISISNNASNPVASKTHTGKEKQSVFGTASLGWHGAFLDGTFRNDWSSTLPAANNSYFYYSGSTSLVFTELLPKLQTKTLSFLKLRASYARVGNDTGFDRLINGYTYGGNFKNTMAWYSGSTVRNNNQLKPETTISSEVGLEVRLWKDRFKADITYYSKYTRDQIIQSALSYLSGYQRVLINSGEISNKGWEVSLSGTPVKVGKFDWQTTVNWSKNNSMVESLPEGIDKIEIGRYGTMVYTYAEPGKPYGAMYAKAFKRNEQGQVLCDMNGKPLESTDYAYVGSVQAKWRGGWQNTFRYGHVSLSVMIDFQHGGRFFSQSMFQATKDGQSVTSLQGRDADLFSRLVLGEKDEERMGFLTKDFTLGGQTNGQEYPDWANPKGVAVPNAVYDESAGPELAGKPVHAWVKPSNYWTDWSENDLTRFIYHASFIKLREVTLGYDFPKKWLRTTPFQTVRVAAVGTNLATLLDRTPKGLDPQATSTTGNAQGFEKGFNYPQATMGVDVKVTF